MTKIKFLSVEKVLFIHDDLIIKFGGKSGIRDLGLLESAIYHAQASFGGNFIYSDIYEMAAAYFYHIIKNHPFFDGNKRTAVMSVISFLECNDYLINFSAGELYLLAIKTANSKLSKKEIAQILKKNSLEN